MPLSGGPLSDGGINARANTMPGHTMSHIRWQPRATLQDQAQPSTCASCKGSECPANRPASQAGHPPLPTRARPVQISPLPCGSDDTFDLGVGCCLPSRGHAPAARPDHRVSWPEGPQPAKLAGRRARPASQPAGRPHGPLRPARASRRLPGPARLPAGRARRDGRARQGRRDGRPRTGKGSARPPAGPAARRPLPRGPQEIRENSRHKVPVAQYS